MIVTTLLAVTVAAAEPTAPAQPAAPFGSAAEKKMDCCEKMKKGEGCDCCKDMEKTDAAHDAGEHGHDH
jgi:hypothetical protein